MPEYIVTALAAICVAVIEAIAAKDRRNQKKEQGRTNQRAELRAEESRLSMAMMYATLQLSEVSSNALTNGHNNGNVERARNEATRAKQEYEEFLQRLAARQIAKP